MRILNCDLNSGIATILADKRDPIKEVGELLQTDRGLYVVLKKVNTENGMLYTAVTTDPVYNK